MKKGENDVMKSFECEDCYKRVFHNCHENKSNCLYFEKNVSGKEVFRRRIIYFCRSYYNKLPKVREKFMVKIDGKLQIAIMSKIESIDIEDDYYKITAIISYMSELEGIQISDNRMITNYYEFRRVFKGLIKKRKEHGTNYE
jgi:hypothetical protein